MKLVRISDDSLARSCGADALADAFSAAGLEVERVSSWGLHWLEPLVELDGIGFGPASVDDVPSIIDGTCSLNIGRIEKHPFLQGQQRLTFMRAGKTRALSLEDYEATGGWAGLERARSISPEQIVDEVTRSGLRGRGGAGFPAGVKWRTVAQAHSSKKYIVCNADEGDSGTFADRMLIEGDPFALIEGMAIAGLAVGADKGFVYLRSEYPDAIRKFDAAISLAASKVAPFELELRVGAGAYVCGEETSLLNSLEGKRGEVRAKPPLPALEGAFGKPTVVNNVLTLAAIPHILQKEGAEHYQKLGIDRSKGTMPIQLAGNVKYGGLYEVAFGITLGELVNEIGGGTASGRPVKAVHVGGPLGAYIHPGQFDLPFGYESFGSSDALIGHGGVVVFDDTADMRQLARFAFEFCAAESCGKCTPCRIGAVRGAELVDKIGRGARTPDVLEMAPQMHNTPKHARSETEQVQLLEDLCEVMRDGSLCALGGFTPYPVQSALRHWPEDFGVSRGAVL